MCKMNLWYELYIVLIYTFDLYINKLLFIYLNLIDQYKKYFKSVYSF